MTQGQVLDPITAPQNIFLSTSPTRSRTVCCMVSPSPPVTTRVVPIRTPLHRVMWTLNTHEHLYNSIIIQMSVEHPMLIRMWRELGSVVRRLQNQRCWTDCNKRSHSQLITWLRRGPMWDKSVQGLMGKCMKYNALWYVCLLVHRVWKGDRQ